MAGGSRIARFPTGRNFPKVTIIFVNRDIPTLRKNRNHRFAPQLLRFDHCANNERVTGRD
jgi:hypothetical protein